MPNWCEGTLRIRGKQKDIRRFLKEGLEPAMGSKVVYNSDEQIRYDGCIWIKNTHRGFVDDVDVWFGKRENDQMIIALHASFAWNIDAYPFIGISQEYNIDLRIYGFERGMEFCQDIEVIDGKITKDDFIKYEDYLWDCPCPLLGG